MLAGERAAVLEHQGGHVGGDRLEPAHAFLGLEVHDRTDVEAADRGVRVDPGLGAVAGDDVEELGDVVAEPLGGDRRVLDERDRLGVTFLGHRQAQRHLAELPDPRLRPQDRARQPVDADAAPPQVGVEGVEPGGELGRVVAGELDDQDCAGVAAGGSRGAVRRRG